jgi:hypothetical protein
MATLTGRYAARAERQKGTTHNVGIRRLDKIPIVIIVLVVLSMRGASRGVKKRDRSPGWATSRVNGPAKLTLVSEAGLDAAPARRASQARPRAASGPRPSPLRGSATCSFAGRGAGERRETVGIKRCVGIAPVPGSTGLTPTRRRGGRAAEASAVASQEVIARPPPHRASWRARRPRRRGASLGLSEPRE